MSMYENVCVICRRPTLGVTGWEAGLIAHDLVLAPWAGEGAFIEGHLHLACVRSWVHKDAFFAELMAAHAGAPDSEIVLRDRFSGELESLSRRASARYRPVHTEPGLLIVLARQLKRWTAIDTDWGWISLETDQAERIARDDRGPVEGGSLRLSLDRDLPAEAADWSVGELLDHLDLEPRYPGLRATPGVTMDLHFPAFERSPAAIGVALDVPLLVPERIRAYFAQLLADKGPAAFQDRRRR